MGFLRQNLFYVVLVAVVAVAGGAMASLYVSWTGQWDRKVSERKALAKELSTQARKKKVNPKLVEVEKTRVESIRQAAVQIKDSSAEWNRRQVLEIPVVDSDGNVVNRPAFPFEGEVKGSARFEYARQYVSQIQALLAKIEATWPPRQEEIDDQIDKAAQRIRLQRILEARQAGAATPAAGAGDFGAGRDDSADLMAQAAEEGRAAALVSRANGGAIYATIDSFDCFFTKALPNISDTEMWEAQVNLWVQQDIAEAIAETNRIAHEQSAARDKKLRVPISAVKHLESVTITEECFTGAGGSSSSAARGRRSERGDDWSRGGDDWSRGADDWRPGGRAEPSYEPTGAAGMGVNEAATLTRRVTGTNFDVIRYSFTVIMPLRYLVLLEQQLQKLPYHTVLGHSYSQPGKARTDSYYYGTDPVMSVTIDAEMLLVSSWVRPLMPVAALAKLQQLSPSAIRPEDQERLGQGELGAYD